MRKPSATLVGAFVLGAVALIVAGVLFFGSGALPKKRIPMASFFEGSVAGLRVGAPVTYRGVRIGEVKAIDVRFNPNEQDTVIQVGMELFPETVTLTGGGAPLKDEDLVPDLVRRGLTARLVLDSFVTRLLSVDLDFRPGAHVSRRGEPGSAPEVPTVPGDWEALAKQLQEVDIAAVLQGVQQTFASVNSILASPEVKQTIHDLPLLVSDLRRTANSVDRTVNTIDREVTGLSREARATIANLDKTLAAAQTLVADLDREATSTLVTARGTFETANTTLSEANALLDPRGRTMMQVQRAVDDVAVAAGRLRNFAERVDRDPSVLVRGR
jgi:paraquat-inducible protein B